MNFLKSLARIFILQNIFHNIPSKINIYIKTALRKENWHNLWAFSVMLRRGNQRSRNASSNSCDEADESAILGVAVTLLPQSCLNHPYDRDYEITHHHIAVRPRRGRERGMCVFIIGSPCRFRAPRLLFRGKLCFCGAFHGASGHMVRPFRALCHGSADLETKTLPQPKPLKKRIPASSLPGIR